MGKAEDPDRKAGGVGGHGRERCWFIAWTTSIYHADHGPTVSTHNDVINEHPVVWHVKKLTEDGSVRIIFYKETDPSHYRFLHG
jgi:hypothetical protein